ncbi:D-alanyl-D-alanine carboxypeptidase PBP3 [Streptococcus suis]|uniref:D-alanyl-D-alanine carboxypeptidase PBP3 n=1 Tax=Streptococcus suis TaxID=1307 RepID=UPI001ABE6ECA|nr:D-alanyl-D-alanine carboxypeptidase PBP3 [Streptococcus suis]
MIKFLRHLMYICLFFVAVLPSAVYAEEYQVAADHALAFEVSTGKILYSKDPDTKTKVASVSKLLSIYLFYQAIENGTLSMDTQVTISDYPYSLTVDSAVSNVNLDARQYSVQDLLHAVIISSANSATIALAEAIAGSEPAFVDLMKAQLNEWGFNDYTLVNATGLSNSFLGDNIYPGSSTDDENMLSATTVAYIARRLLLDYPQVLDISSRASYLFGGYYYASTNAMLEGGTYARAGVDGLKTGMSDTAGASFVATTKENDMRIVTVLLNATDGVENPDNRFVASNDLMNYVFQYFTLKTLVAQGQAYQSSSVAIFNGQKDRIGAIAASNLHYVLRLKNTEPVTASFTPSASVLDAPLEKGSAVGQLQLTDTDFIGNGYIGEQPSITMVAKSTAEEANWPISWWNHFVRYVNENL